jgi:hypothetical protein
VQAVLTLIIGPRASASIAMAAAGTCWSRRTMLAGAWR